MHRLASSSLALVLFACGAEPLVGPVAPPPSDDFAFFIGDPVPGTDAVWHVLDAPPGRRVFLVASKGGLGTGTCFTQLGGRCMDITEGTSGYVFLDDAYVGDDGRLSRRLPVPAGLIPGGSWAVQVVSPGGPNTLLSNPTTMEIREYGAYCADDGFEDNDAITNPTPVETGFLGDLRACDDDSYEVDIPPETGIEATLRYDPYSTLPDLYVRVDANTDYSAEGIGVDVASAANTTGQPAVGRIDVGLVNGLEGWYDLELRYFPWTACVPDALEEDDFLGVANTMSDGDRLEATACEGDPDLFAFQVLDDQVVQIVLDRPDDGGQATAELYDANGTFVTDTNLVDGAEITTIAQVPGIWSVRVEQDWDDARGGGIPYGITTRVFTRTFCEDDRFEVNDSPSTATRLLPLLHTDLTACTADTFDVYEVPVLAGEPVDVQLRFEHRDADLDLLLLSPAGDVLAVSGSTTDDEQVTWTPTADGTVFVEVQVFADPGDPMRGGAPYALDVAVGPRGAPAVCAAGVMDADSDGVCDDVELCVGDDAVGDADADGLCDDLDALMGADPLDADSDDDGVGDLEEVLQGLSPSDPDSDDDGACDGDRFDNDGDGLDPLDPCVSQGGFVSLSLNDDMGCALRAGGNIECWGTDTGQDGLFGFPAGRFAAVGIGWNHGCALDLNGEITCWGDPSDGRTIPPAGTFHGLSVGGSHTCALDDLTDEVVCWGANVPGPNSPPTGAFSQVSAGPELTCGIRDSGALACWGNNHHGQASPPSGVWFAVSAGANHACALDSVGATTCWGITDGSSSDEGQVTDALPGPFLSLSSGFSHVCGLRATGNLQCWGSNLWGESSAPSGPWSAFALGGSSNIANTCAIDAGENIVCWGYDGQGQSTPPPR